MQIPIQTQSFRTHPSAIRLFRQGIALSAIALGGICAPFAVQAQGSNSCVPGPGKDYQVGPGAAQLATLDLVPWDKLTAGDTVRIFYKDTPYNGKFMVSGNGTAQAPIRICGVKSATGQRPVVDGSNAVAPRGLAYGDLLHETRSIILVKQVYSQIWTAFPTYIRIDGLEIRGAVPGNSFVDSTGTVRKYESFGACIWLERGQNITIADNVIHDCTNGIFSKSTNDGEFAVTKNVRIAGNYIYGNGVVGDVHQHNVYMASSGITYEFNRFEGLRPGALGNNIKDRSAGTIARYNYLSGGAYAMDFVEAEDFATIATRLPSYRATWVYGNVIVKNGNTGSVIHYGGDHYYSIPGAHWGEPIFRKGTLYFYNNTVSINGTAGQLFQLSTTEESAEVWNNVFHFAPTVAYPSLRVSSETNTASWTPGGKLNLGKNWASSNLADSDPWHWIPGSVTGWSNLIRGNSAPFDPASFVPLSGSALLNSAQAILPAAAGYPADMQLDFVSFKIGPRKAFGSGSDMGAVERMSN